LEQSCKGTQRLIEQVRLVLDKDRREGIVEELLSVFICWEDPLAAVSLGSLRALVVARHPKPSRCRVEPWCGAEHAHDALNREGRVSDQCKLIDRAQQHRGC